MTDYHVCSDTYCANIVPADKAWIAKPTGVHDGAIVVSTVYGCNADHLASAVRRTTEQMAEAFAADDDDDVTNGQPVRVVAKDGNGATLLAFTIQAEELRPGNTVDIPFGTPSGVGDARVHSLHVYVPED